MKIWHVEAEATLDDAVMAELTLKDIEADTIKEVLEKVEALLPDGFIVWSIVEAKYDEED